MVGEDYIYWLFDRYGIPGYEDLFRELAKRNYIWQMVLDESRARSGMALRQQFAYETGIYLSDVAEGPCSCLEMICALSSDMYDMCGKEDPRYFAGVLITNLGLGFFTGSLTNEDRNQINYILDVWLNREYTADGKGNIFDFSSKQISKDIRTMDVWSQMNLYLNQFYPLDDYLRS